MLPKSLAIPTNFTSRRFCNTRAKNEHKYSDWYYYGIFGMGYVCLFSFAAYTAGIKPYQYQNSIKGRTEKYNKEYNRWLDFPHNELGGGPTPPRRTAAEHYEMIQYDPEHLKRMLPQDITYEMCEYAVNNYSYLLHYVPKKIMNRKLCLTALCTFFRENKTSDYPWYVIPKEYKTDDFFMSLISSVVNKKMATVNGVLEKIPEEYKTKKVCEYAILQHNATFRHIPKENITSDMYEKMLIKEPALWLSIPENIITADFCEKVFLRRREETFDYSIKYMPKKFLTEEMCQLAYDYDKDSILHMPDKFITKEKCSETKTKWIIPSCLQYMDKAYIDAFRCKQHRENSTIFDGLDS
jgi:hypothetical protein